MIDFNLFAGKFFPNFRETVKVMGLIHLGNGPHSLGNGTHTLGNGTHTLGNGPHTLGNGPHSFR